MYEYKIIYDPSNQGFKDMHGCEYWKWNMQRATSTPPLPDREEVLNWYAARGWRLQATDTNNHWYLERWIDEADRPYTNSD